MKDRFEQWWASAGIESLVSKECASGVWEASLAEPAIDLRAKLEALRELQSEIEATGDAALDSLKVVGTWKVREWGERLKAILEGKDRP